MSTGRRPTLDRRPPPPLPTRDENGQPITATHVLVERYGPDLACASDRCLQHIAVKGDIARHDTELRRLWRVANDNREKLAALRPWVTLVASIGAAVAATLIGRLV